MGITDYITRMFARDADTSQHSPRLETRSRSNIYPAKRFYREDLGIEFKSSMESNFYRYMRQFHPRVKIEYEPVKVKLYDKDIHSYVPDFKCFLANKIWFIECKGYMDEVSWRKIQLFRNQYPYYQLMVVDGRFYRFIKQRYSKLVVGWEN